MAWGSLKSCPKSATTTSSSDALAAEPTSWILQYNSRIKQSLNSLYPWVELEVQKSPGVLSPQPHMPFEPLQHFLKGYISKPKQTEGILCNAKY